MNAPMRLAEIVKKLQQALPELRSKYHVKGLEVFGSYVRGEEQENSDLDVLVEFSEIPGLFKFLELEYYLSDLIGVKVDLVMKSSLKPAIRERVLSEAQPI
jgi:hypothetical protein